MKLPTNYVSKQMSDIKLAQDSSQMISTKFLQIIHI